MENKTLFARIPIINRLVFMVGLAGILAGSIGIKVAQNPSWIKFFDNLHWTSGTAAAAVLVWLGWRANRQGESGTSKWFVAGFAGYAIGQIIWDGQTALGYSQFPSPSDLFYLWLGPCLTMGLIQGIRHSSRKLNQGALLLDVLALSTAALTLVLALYLPKRGDLDLFSIAVLVSYPVSLLIPTCIGLIMIPAMRLRSSFSLLLFLPAVAVTAWSWMKWNLMALDGVAIDGSGFNVSFSIAILTAGIAASAWQLEYSDSPRWDRVCESSLRMLPIVTILLACGAIIAADSIPGVPEIVASLAHFGSALVIALAIIRQSRLLKERDLLLATQAEALKTGELLQSIIETAPIRVFWKDRELRYLGCNTSFAQDAGYNHPDEIIGKTDFELSWKALAELYRTDDDSVINSGISKINFDEPNSASDGQERWLRTSKMPLRNSTDGQIIGVLGIYEDITERKQAEELLRIAAVTFETQEGIMITDAYANIIRVNQAFQDITGYSSAEVLGKNPNILKSDVQDKFFYIEMWQHLLTHGAWSGELWDKRKDGKIYPKALTITAVKNALGETTQYVGIFNDITLRKQAEEEIYQLAFHDSLTKLPNRSFLLERFRMSLSTSARSHHFGAVFFLDMDRFKTLNDTLGHDCGDLLLVEVAGRIQHCIREVDTVARIGGDEFVILLEEVGQNIDEASKKAALIAEKIRAALTAPYSIKGNDYHGSPSIGVCLYCGNEESVDDLLRHADMAMYKAKDSGRNRVQFFDPAMQHTIELHAALEMDLLQALSSQQLQLHYQVQIDVDHRPIGVEALVRWIHPTRGIVPPMQFIPIAEESSLILEIGNWVLDKACQQIAQWSVSEQTRELTIAVNVSSHQFKLHDFVDGVATMIRAHHIDPTRLKLELTESVVLNDITDVVVKMHALKGLGVGISLDDFGTGYSSLSYLKQLPLDQLKIDQSFVRDITTDPNDAVMVQTIIDMAKNFGLNVIAEGVETESQLSFLEHHGCMAYQGYLFSKPLPIEEFNKFLELNYAKQV